jgi:MYXO-CTERM domain-containing protein
MRAAWVTLLLVSATLQLLPPAASQAEEPFQAAEDNASDVQVVTPGGTQPAPAGARPDLDLLGLTVRETPESFVFTVSVTDVRPGDEGRGEDGAIVDVQFTHNGREFLARLVHQLPSVSDWVSVSLGYRDAPGAPWNRVWTRPEAAQLDGNANTYTATLPRADLADPKGAAPFPGRTLEAFSVHAWNLFGNSNIGFFVVDVPNPATLVDHMPDSGAAPAKLAVQHGLHQRGHARLTSEEPFRASNGEATTFIFKAQAHNIGDEADRFQLRATRLPPGWNVILPTPTFELDGGSSLEVAVVANQPFSHTHGATASFILQMTSASDPEGQGVLGQLEMGARYLTVPQPAGHHDTVYLHSRAWNELSSAFGTVFCCGGSGYLFMNTMEQFEGDEGIPMPPQNSNPDFVNDRPVERYTWCVTLDPGLQMGLDFKPGELARLDVNVKAVDPLTDATLAAELMVVPDDNRWGCFDWFGDQSRTVATLNTTQPVSIGANAEGQLGGDLQVWRSADRIPYLKGQNLMLRIEVTALTVPDLFVTAGMPSIVPGSTLRMPLVDYKDDIKEVLTTRAGPALTPLGPQERRANPGGTIVFPISVANDGATDLVLGFNVTGPNSQWAQLPGGGAIAVPAHDTARADLVVKVPADAKEGDVADLVLQAFDQANQTSRGLARLLVTVVTDEQVPDDAGQAVQADPPKKSPGPAALAVLAGLALVAVVRRRRAA